MNKRFDYQSAKLLKLLGKDKCLDDLFIDEPEIDPIAEKVRAIGQAVREKKRKATPMDIAFLQANFKTYEAQRLKLLEYVSPNLIGMATEQLRQHDALAKKFPGFKAQIDQLCKQIKPSVYFVTTRTANAIMETKATLGKKLKSLMPDISSESGILFFDKIMKTDHTHKQLAYHIDTEGFSGIELFHLRGEADQVVVGNFFHLDFSNPNEIYCGDDPDGIEAGFFAYCLLSILFIQFFEVEKVVAVQPAANTSRYSRVSLGEDTFESNIPYPVNIIDASWYTTIIRVDPFLTSGHFRRQPYGPGRSEYKMIWIKAYMKQGYTRKSKHQPNGQI